MLMRSKEDTTMKHARIVAVAGLVLLGTAAGRLALADHHEGAVKPAPVTLEGEVIDLQCALLHPGAAGASEHSACARSCIGKGLPAGLKVGDQAYLLLAKGHAPVRDLAKYAGENVAVTGVVSERFGLKALRVDAVKRLGAAKPAEKPVARDVWMCPMGCVKSDKPGKCSACGMEMEKAKKG
jgi:hypothetical protein